MPRATSRRQIDRRPSSTTDRGALRRGSLRFLDGRVERQYQRHGRGGEPDRIPHHHRRRGRHVAPGRRRHSDRHTDPSDLAIPVCLAHGVTELGGLPAFGPARTRWIDSTRSSPLLTTVNGLVILWLASTGGVLPGYGISAIMLLFVFGFVARTGFIFAAWRSAVIVVGFVVAAILDPGPGQPPGGRFHLRSRRDRHPPGSATPRAVTPPCLLSGHRHHRNRPTR